MFNLSPHVKENTMLTYLAKTEINGVEIRLIKSQFGFVVIYGMERTEYTKESIAWGGYRCAVDHAIHLP